MSDGLLFIIFLAGLAIIRAIAAGNQHRQVLEAIHTQGEKTLVALADLAKVEAAEREDLATLSGLVTQILTAVATGQMDQTAAQALLDAMSGDDATVKSNIAAIQAALPATGGTAPAE